MAAGTAPTSIDILPGDIWGEICCKLHLRTISRLLQTNKSIKTKLEANLQTVSWKSFFSQHRHMKHWPVLFSRLHGLRRFEVDIVGHIDVLRLWITLMLGNSFTSFSGQQQLDQSSNLENWQQKEIKHPNSQNIDEGDRVWFHNRSSPMPVTALHTVAPSLVELFLPLYFAPIDRIDLLFPSLETLKIGGFCNLNQLPNSFIDLSHCSKLHTLLERSWIALTSTGTSPIIKIPCGITSLEVTSFVLQCPLDSPLELRELSIQYPIHESTGKYYLDRRVVEAHPSADNPNKPDSPAYSIIPFTFSSLISITITGYLTVKMAEEIIFPPMLTYLDIGLEPYFIKAKSLPASLSTVAIRYSAPLRTMAPIGSMFPNRVTRVSIHGLQPGIMSCFSGFPKGLLHLSLSDVTLKSREGHNIFSQLPQGLKTLQVPTLSFQVIKSCPQSITILSVATSEPVDSLWNSTDPSALNSNLKSLEISSSSETPTSLHDLIYTRSTHLMDPPAVNLFPKLQSLKIWVTLLPKCSFPPNLTELSICTRGTVAGSISIRCSVAWVETLPSSLVSLTIDPPFLLTAAAVAKLPRSITHIGATIPDIPSDSWPPALSSVICQVNGDRLLPAYIEQIQYRALD